MSTAKPIKLYDHKGGQGPNPWKVVIILEELNIPFEQHGVEFSEMKKEPFISVNPNGRVPAIEDPNTGVTLWESGAIIEYLIDTYDKEAKLHYTTSPEKYIQNSWKHFQMSGQGPYFGQKAWFTFFHSEKIPSAIERYEKEIWRVLEVIDAHLTKTGQPYLVGDKVCYADLMFIPWNNGVIGGIMGPDFKKEFETKLPKAAAWHQSLIARDGVKRALELQAKTKAAAASH